MKRIALCLVVICVAAASVSGDIHSGYDRSKGKRLFYRILGSQSNGPFVRKTRTVAGPDGAVRVATTGMANSGFTEYPFCSEAWSFTFRENMGLYPRVASGVEMDTSRVNTCDLLVDWVYEPDGIVWGPACRQFSQSFVARGRELVSLTMLVASPMAELTVAVHEDGPYGREIAAAQTFKSGHSMEWGYARWSAGEARLEPGRSYLVRVWREDGQAWNPYFHGAGNIYDEGQAYFDGVARAESDLAMWIMEEPEDIKRAIVAGGEEDGWVRNVKGVTVTPRSRNIRLITADVGPVKEFCHNVVAYVWTDESRSELVCGPKYCHACARVNTAYMASFIYGPGEFDCDEGESYYVEIFTVGFEEGKEPVIEGDRSTVAGRNLLVRAYGETGETASVLYNLTAEPVNERELALSWRLSRPTVVEIEVFARPRHQRITQSSGTEGSYTLGPLESGRDVDFRITAGAGERCSPVYRVRMPGGEEAEALWPETPQWFVPVAPRWEPDDFRQRVFLPKKNLLDDGGFEKGLGAWTETKTDISAVSSGDADITPVRGKSMYGFTHRAEGERRDVLLVNGITQKIKTRPGRRYEISLHAITDVGDGPRGDTRVRIAADADGGDDFSGGNSSQWFWTEGRWRRLTHSFVAKSEESAVLVEFFRWRDLDAASAYIDDIRVYED